MTTLRWRIGEPFLVLYLGIASDRCRRTVASHGVKVVQRLRVGVDQAGFTVSQAVFVAKAPDDWLGVAEVGSRHAGKQVMLDLVVQAAEGEVHQPAAADVAGGQHLPA